MGLRATLPNHIPACRFEFLIQHKTRGEEGEVIMSSSKSDVVTHSVCLSIRNQGVARKFKGCLKYKECFKKVSRMFHVSFKGCLQKVSMVFQVNFKGDSRKFQGCCKEVSRVF